MSAAATGVSRGRITNKLTSFEGLKAAALDHGYAAPAAALLGVLLILIALRGPSMFTGRGLTIAASVAAPLVLATMALTPVAIAGRGGIDLSVGPLMGFINVTIVVWLLDNGVSNPVLIVGYALGIALVAGLINGLLVAVVRLQPIIAALGGYLVLSGLATYVLPSASGSVPAWLSGMAGKTDGVPTAAVIVIGVFMVWTWVSRTALFRNIRMLGGDERAAYASAVAIRPAHIAAYCIAAIFAGLAALMLTAVIASGNASQGPTYTLTSVAALALGGVSLAGGRGGMLGAVLGALDIYCLNYVLDTFNFGVNAANVTQMFYGLVLVLAIAISGATRLLLARRRLRAGNMK